MHVLALASVTLLGMVPPVCSIEVNPFAPGRSETFFWGVFSDEMLEAPPGDHSLRVEPGHWSVPDSGSAVYGQVVYVGEVAGYASAELRRTAGDSGPIRAAVVLWDYDAGCEPIRFGNGSPWGVVGDTAYFRATLRDSSQWADGVPTFDAYWAGGTIYPFTATEHGREFREHVRSGWGEIEPEDREEKHLTPVQAFRLVQALPGSCDYVSRAFVARMRLRWVLWRWKEFEGYYPADRIFGYHRELSAGENELLKRWCESEGESG